nr:reverse transcriptase domain-containing protein [Tanacetum cinerariifolium]
MRKYGVTHRLSTAYHPQISGQVEVSNRGSKRILERTIGQNRVLWSDKLDDALWAFCTTYKTPIGCTPYKLVYGKACHLPMELEHKAYWAQKQTNFDLTVAGDHRKIQLNELNKLRKLKTRWSGPFTIAKVFPYGTVELSQADGPNFKVNGHRIKHYFGGDVPQLLSSIPRNMKTLAKGFVLKSSFPLHNLGITISIRSMDSFQGLTPKSPSLWHQPLAPSLNFYDHVNPITRQTIDQSADGKLHDLNPEESQTILEDLALYNNESWNDPRDFAKSVKAIVLPQDVSSTSDRIPMVPKIIEAISHDESIHKHKLDDMVKGNEDIKEQSKEEYGIETDMEVEEVIEEEESEFETNEEVEEIFDEDEDDESFNLFPTMKELSHHKWLLKHPRPPWVKEKVRAESPNNIKISCMIGHIFKRHAYIDLESPINIMSRHQYNKILTYGLRSSIIDCHLGEMVFRKPFIDETNLVYSEENGTVMFKQGDEKITFRMPYTMEIFKQTRLMGFSIDSIPPFAYEENFGLGKTHYY